MPTIILLILSNCFMTYAWYGHLQNTQTSLWKTILMSWGIAFFEYCLMVPANRLGYTSGFSASQLKITQEGITLVIFMLFAIFILKEQIKWNYLVSFGLVLLAVFFAFKKWE